MKWKRKRPGLYQVHNKDGDLLAQVERGAETGWWYWAVWWGTREEACSFAGTLRVAKGEAEEFVA